jgi:alpha/beta superfamily hydrolase
MNASTAREFVAGAAGRIECALDLPDGDAKGVAVVAHPHPLFGGTLDNKVVQTLARAFLQAGYAAVRPNFRGVGDSEGVHDEGRGEADDMRAVVAHYRKHYPDDLRLAGFSFGGFVMTHVAATLTPACKQLVLVGPAARFGLANVASNTLIIHGEQDDVVPLAGVMDWARPQSLPIIVLPGVGHFFHGQLPLLKRCILQGLEP